MGGSRPAASCGGRQQGEGHLGCQGLARDLGFQAPLLAFLRERGGRTIHLRQGRVDIAKTLTRQSSGPPLLGSRSPHHHHHHLLPWPTSGEWEQKPRCCYSYFSFTSLQSGFYSQSSVVSNLEGSFTLKKCFAFVYHFFVSLSYYFIIILILY